MAKDLECMLRLAQQQGEVEQGGWPYAIVLQDDVQLSSQFFPRVRAMLRTSESGSASVPTAPSSAWAAWVLFHAEEFDHGRIYADGAPYHFEACGQAILYRTSKLGGLIEHVSRQWRHDPDDWQLRDYQRASGALVRVAVPSLVQHIGQVSSLAAKQKDGGGIMSGCWAREFLD